MSKLCWNGVGRLLIRLQIIFCVPEGIGGEGQGLLVAFHEVLYRSQRGEGLERVHGQ